MKSRDSRFINFSIFETFPDEEENARRKKRRNFYSSDVLVRIIHIGILVNLSARKEIRGRYENSSCGAALSERAHFSRRRIEFRAFPLPRRVDDHLRVVRRNKVRSARMAAETPSCTTLVRHSCDATSLEITFRSLAKVFGSSWSMRRDRRLFVRTTDAVFGGQQRVELNGRRVGARYSAQRKRILRKFTRTAEYRVPVSRPPIGSTIFCGRANDATQSAESGSVRAAK